MRHAVETDIIIPTASATRHATSLFYLSVKNQQKAMITGTTMPSLYYTLALK